MQEEQYSKNITVVGNDDFAFAERLLKYPVILSQYWKSVTINLDAENQNRVVTMTANNYPVLVKDIMVVTYCQLGGWEVSPATPRDRITVSIKSGRSDEYFMDEAIDIVALSPNVDRKITPFLIREDSNLKIEFKHSRSVGNKALNFPKEGETLKGNKYDWFLSTNDPAPQVGGTLEDNKYGWLLSTNDPAANPFPILCNLIISGSKIFKYVKEK